MIDVNKKYKLLALGLLWLHLPWLVMNSPLTVVEEGTFYPGAIIFTVLMVASSLAFWRGDARWCANWAGLAVVWSSIALLRSDDHALAIFLSLAILKFFNREKPVIFAAAVISLDVLLLSAYPSPWFIVSVVMGFTAISVMRIRMASELAAKDEQVKAVSAALKKTSSLAHREHMRAEQAEQDREQFLGAMVHQLKTPLTVMGGYAEMLITHWGRLPDERRLHFINQILDGTSRMERAIETDLNAIKSDSEGWRTECALIDINAEVEEVVENLSIRFDRVEFWKGDLSGLALADKRVLQIVLEHLVENAYTHGYKTHPIIVAVDEDERCIELSVSGYGPAERRLLGDWCFERGRRDGASEGTGLGLWIVRNYARSMSGDVEVTQADKGNERFTKFSVYLPKGVVPQTPERQLQEKNYDAVDIGS